jgi:hypothetical protein
VPHPNLQFSLFGSAEFHVGPQPQGASHRNCCIEIYTSYFGTVDLQLGPVSVDLQLGPVSVDLQLGPVSVNSELQASNLGDSLTTLAFLHGRLLEEPQERAREQYASRLNAGRLDNRSLHVSFWASIL